MAQCERKASDVKEGDYLCVDADEYVVEPGCRVHRDCGPLEVVGLQKIEDDANVGGGPGIEFLVTFDHGHAFYTHSVPPDALVCCLERQGECPNPCQQRQCAA